MLNNKGKIPFVKYHGTGNDFIMINHFEKVGPLDPKNYDLIQKMCSRHFGIGADGLIILEQHRDADFYMNYYNADGKPGSFCGNGSRCTVAFAQSVGLIGNQTRFMASDGSHIAFNEENLIYVKMQCKEITQVNNHWILDTGSPHYVQFYDDLSNVDVYHEGQVIRYSSKFAKEGINVNFVKEGDYGLMVKTYERGVENITLSCGTGVTAAALAYFVNKKMNQDTTIPISSLGGPLKVRIKVLEDKIDEIWLGGPTQQVYEGSWLI